MSIEIKGVTLFMLKGIGESQLKKSLIKQGLTIKSNVGITTIRTGDLHGIIFPDTIKKITEEQPDLFKEIKPHYLFNSLVEKPNPRNRTLVVDTYCNLVLIEINFPQNVFKPDAGQVLNDILEERNS